MAMVIWPYIIPTCYFSIMSKNMRTICSSSSCLCFMFIIHIIHIIHLPPGGVAALASTWWCRSWYSFTGTCTISSCGCGTGMSTNCSTVRCWILSWTTTCATVGRKGRPKVWRGEEGKMEPWVHLTQQRGAQKKMEMEVVLFYEDLATERRSWARRIGFQTTRAGGSKVYVQYQPNHCILVHFITMLTTGCYSWVDPPYEWCGTPRLLTWYCWSYIQ